MKNCTSITDIMAKARRGEALSVVFLGGSLTWGANASDPNLTSWRGRTMAELRRRYPDAKWHFADAAIGGTGSQLGIFRLEHDVFRHQPDLVILDFTLNDYLSGSKDGFHDRKNQSYEAIIRSCLMRNIAVLPVFLAAREHVEDPDISKWRRRLEHIRLFAAYQLEYADILALMNRDFQAGRLDLDQLWLPEHFDTTHPHDEGYAAYTKYFFAEWERIEKSAPNPVHLPDEPLCGKSYRYFTRIELSSLRLPGWQIRKPVVVADSYDWLSSRWIDDLIMQSNAEQYGTLEWRKSPDKKLVPFSFTFQGENAAILMETLPESAQFMISVDDGQPRSVRFRQVKRSQLHFIMLCENLAPDKIHTIKVIPQVPTGSTPALMRWSVLLLNGSAGAKLVSWE